jgi:hypothetical protein
MRSQKCLALILTEFEMEKKHNFMLLNHGHRPLTGGVSGLDNKSSSFKPNILGTDLSVAEYAYEEKLKDFRGLEGKTHLSDDTKWVKCALVFAKDSPMTTLCWEDPSKAPVLVVEVKLRHHKLDERALSKDYLEYYRLSQELSGDSGNSSLQEATIGESWSIIIVEHSS